MFGSAGLYVEILNVVRLEAHSSKRNVRAGDVHPARSGIEVAGHELYVRAGDGLWPGKNIARIDCRIGGGSALEISTRPWRGAQGPMRGVAYKISGLPRPRSSGGRECRSTPEKADNQNAKNHCN